MIARGFCRAPRQPEHNSTAACASAERHNASQSTTARRRALLQSATPARAQQHGGVRFYRAPPRQPVHNSTAACASAEHHASQGKPARLRRLAGALAAASWRLQMHRAVPTQFKATQLVVAIAVWATQRSDPDFNLSILLLNNASEQYYITIG